MGKDEFTIRDYEKGKGDEEVQANIFNTVIVEMNPEATLIKPEKVKKRHEEPDFNPAQVKYLEKDGKIVGYNECRVHDGFHGVFYPLILKEYRSEETLNMLFSAVYDFARENQKKQPGTIESHYSLVLKDAHDYFTKQKIAKITDTRETKGIYVDVETLANYEVEGYEAKPFTPENIPDLLALRTSKESMVGDDITAEILEKRVKDGEMTAENTVLIYRDGSLVGYARAGKYSPADYGEEDTTVYGSLLGMIIDIEDPDGINLRKAMFKALSGYYKKHGIKKQNSGIYVNSPAVKIYEKLGYKDEATPGAKHYIYEK